MNTKSLTEEEKAFFESGGQTELPDDYASDMKLPQPDEDAGEEVNNGGENVDTGQAETTAENQPEASASEQSNDAQAPKQEDKGNHTVPLSVLMEEKRKRQETERRLEEMARQQAIVNDRLSQLALRSQQPEQNEPQKPQVPDPELDPIGAAKWAVDQIQAERQQRAQTEEHQRQQFQQQRQRQEYEHRVVNAYRQAAEVHKQHDPDFPQYHDYLMRNRYNELVMLGTPPDVAAHQLKAEEFQLAENALRNGRNPGEVIKALASERGWSKQNSTPQPVAAPEAAERLAKVAQGQQASVSPSVAGTSGNARSSKLDAKALAEMSDKEFAQLLAKDDGEMFRKAMGG